MTAEERIEEIRNYLGMSISQMASIGLPSMHNLSFLLRMYDEALAVNVGILSENKTLRRLRELALPEFKVHLLVELHETEHQGVKITMIPENNPEASE